jgi:hypothetical protein
MSDFRHSYVSKSDHDGYVLATLVAKKAGAYLVATVHDRQSGGMMKRKIAAAVLAVAFSLGGVAFPSTVASAHDKAELIPVKCINPAGKLPPGQQPECKGKAHTQIFKKKDDRKDDDKKDHRDDKKDDDKKD